MSMDSSLRMSLRYAREIEKPQKRRLKIMGEEGFTIKGEVSFIKERFFSGK